MDRMNALVAGLLILTFFLGIGIGHFISAQDESCETGIVDTCSAEITSLDALIVALNDHEVIGLLDKKDIDTIAISKVSSLERDADYTQIVFHPQDPDDRMTPSMIVVQINDSCMVQAAYETYPSYIPETVPKP